MKGKYAFTRVLVLILISIMMIVPAGLITSGSDLPGRADPDLAVEDIWYDSKTDRVSCRIVNLGIIYQGMFTVNLTVNGYLYIQEIVDWAVGQGSVNVTFPQAVMWQTSSVKIGVEIYYHILPVDGNFSNNYRVEIWNRQLPDLTVRSVYRDPKMGNLIVLVENIGPVKGGGYFHVDLWINGWVEIPEMCTDVLAPGDRVEVPFTWVWDRVSNPVVNIDVWVDLPGDVHEMNVSNNLYNVTWRARSPLYFKTQPYAKTVGSKSALIHWTTSIHATTYVEYGKTSKMDLKTGTRDPWAPGSENLQSLSPSTQYTCRVTAEDEFGRIVKSDILSFSTDDPDGSADIKGGFEKSVMHVKPKLLRIPFSASESSGLRKIDIYLDGKLIKSRGGMGKGSIEDLLIDMTMKRAGNHTLLVRVKTLLGEEEEFTTLLVVERTLMVIYPQVFFSPNPTLPRRGSEMFAARCDDPHGMVNATWYVNGEVAEVDVARHPDASYFGPWFTLATTTLEDGEATIGIEVVNHDGNVTTVERTVLIDNILDPPDPDIWVRRGNILRSGTTCTVPLTVSNHGRGTAVDIVVEDWIQGFIPINGDRGTRSDGTISTLWRVVLDVGTLEPDEEVTVTYDCIPVIHEDEEWALGAWIFDRSLGVNYTTIATYQRDDGLVDYSRRYGIPTANFQEGYIMEAGALNAISKSNYMIVTNPVELTFAIGWRPSDMLLMRTAHLASLKWGVFGFAPRIGTRPPSEEDVLGNIIDWSDLMAPSFSDNGYLLILGEDDVIPSWTFEDVINDDGVWKDVDCSDHGYANLDGGEAPELTVGRILGDDLHEMLTPINTSIYVHEGGLYNDHEGKALLLSGAGSGVQSFQNNMDELADQISSTMADLDVIHKGDAFPVLENGFVETDGVTGHMAAGNVDGDSYGEVVIINTVADRVRVFSPDYGGSESFDLVMTDDARVLVGDLIGDATMDIIIIDQSGGNGWLTILETNGDHRDSWIVPWEPGDHVCLGDIDNDGTDDVIIASADDGTFIVEDADGDEITSIDAFFYRPGQRITSADVNSDGWDDIIVANHNDDEVAVFVNERDMTDEWWPRRAVDVPDLDLEDGFGAGSFGVDSGRVRDFAVVIQSDQEGQFTIVWNELGTGPLDWESFASTMMMTPVREGCSVYVTEMKGDGFTEEIVVCEGPMTDDLTILDLGNIGDNFRAAVTPEMSGNDLIVYRDHGNQLVWSGLYDSWDVEGLGMESASHRPVIFGSVCLSGRYTTTEDTFAHACMRNGAGVYLGATEVSLRSSNNAAIQIIVDYTEGVPIGQAFRNFERDFLNSPGTFGLSTAEAKYWCYEYNLYGDPAFGTSGRVVDMYTVTPFFSLFTREEANLEIGDPIFTNDTCGKRVSLPGGSHRYEIGDWVMPYMSYQFDIPQGQTVSSVSVVNASGWNVYNDLYLPPLREIRPDTHMPTRAPEEVDPDDNWDPPVLYEWSVSDHANGNRTLLLNIYPFHYDEPALRGRFCSQWDVNVDLAPVKVEIGDFEGPGSTESHVDIVMFGYEVIPTGGGGMVSISHRIEDESGKVIEVLSASIMDVNVSTRIEESWDPAGAGDYVFVVELRDGEGNPLAEYRCPFQVGVIAAVVKDLEADPAVLGTGNDLSVSMTVENVGNVSLVGNYSITVYGPGMEEIDEEFVDLSLGPGKEVSAEADFDLTGTGHDVYFVRGQFHSDQSSDSLLISVPRTEEAEVIPVEYHLVMDVDPLAVNLTEGDDLWINGTVSRNDTLALPDVAVGVGVVGQEFENSSNTDENGTFSLLIPDLPGGNQTVMVRAVVGDWGLERSLAISVVSIPSDDDDNVSDDDDDNTTDDDLPPDDDNVTDDDDNVTDDDTTPDDDTTDDDTEEEEDEGLDKRWLAVILIILISALILIGLSIYVFSKRSAEDAGDWEE